MTGRLFCGKIRLLQYSPKPKNAIENKKESKKIKIMLQNKS